MRLIAYIMHLYAYLYALSSMHSSGSISFGWAPGFREEREGAHRGKWMVAAAQWGKPMTLSMRSGQNEIRNLATFDNSTQTLD